MRFVDAWREMSNELVPQMNKIFNNYKTSPQGLALQHACDLENLRWNHTHYLFYNIVTHIDWLTERKTWLDKQVNLLNPQGDANYDGRVDVEDVNTVINVILNLNQGGARGASCDVNGDGRVDVEDVNKQVNIILGIK